MKGRVREGNRWYKDGFSPSQIKASFPLEAECARCGGRLLIYLKGNACETCSPQWVQRALAQTLPAKVFA